MLLLGSLGSVLQLAERGSIRDMRYSEFHRDRDIQGNGLWEPSTWVDVALPVARYDDALANDGGVYINEHISEVVFGFSPVSGVYLWGERVCSKYPRAYDNSRVCLR